MNVYKPLSQFYYGCKDLESGGIEGRRLDKKYTHRKFRHAGKQALKEYRK